MKQFLLCLLALTVLQITSFSQCAKNQVLISSRTEYIDGDGDVRKAIDEKTIIEISKTNITIYPSSDHTMTATILSDSCNWKIPYKEGRTQFKASYVERDESVKPITITITGKDGKVSLFVEFDDRPDKKIRVWVDSYEEKK